MDQGSRRGQGSIPNHPRSARSCDPWSLGAVTAGRGDHGSGVPLTGHFLLAECRYLHTQQARADKPCRTPVAGEWYYFRSHNRARRHSDGHVVDPELPRWMALQPAVDRQNRGRRRVERDDIRGVGFVMLFSNRETLLFYKGLAKRPGDVAPGLRNIPGDLRRRFRDLRSLPLREAIGFRGSSEEVLPQGVAARMPRVVAATRWVLGIILVGLLFVLLSVLLSGGWQTAAEFVASTAFITGWSLFRCGIWKKKIQTGYAKGCAKE